jgi:hypothetical protein
MIFVADIITQFERTSRLFRCLGFDLMDLGDGTDVIVNTDDELVVGYEGLEGGGEFCPNFIFRGRLGCFHGELN